MVRDVEGSCKYGDTETYTLRNTGGSDRSEVVRIYY